MIRCPTCGRRMRDAAPVCATHGAPPPVAERPTTRRRSWCRRPSCPSFACGERWGRGASAPSFWPSGSRTASRSRSRSRAPTTSSPARACCAKRTRCRPSACPRPGGLRARRARRRLGLRGAWSSCEAPHPGRPPGGARGSDGARRVRARRAGDADRGRDAPTGAVSSTAISSPRTSSSTRASARKLFDFGLVRNVGDGARPGRVDEGRGAGRNARVHVARAVRGAHGHRRAQRHLRAGRDLLRDAGGRAPVLGQSGRGAAEPPQPAPAGAVAAGADGRRARGRDHALPGQGSERRSARRRPSCGGRCRPASSPSVRAATAPRPRRGRERRRRARPAPAAAAAKPRGAARERRAVALLFFETKSTVAAVREAMTSVGRAAGAHGGHAVRARVRSRAGGQPDARRRQRGGADGHRPRPDHAGAGRPGVGLRSRRAPTGAVATRARCSPRRSGIRASADPAGVLLSPAALEVLARSRRRAAAGSGRGRCGCRRPPQAAEKTTTRMGVAPLVGRDELLRTLLDRRARRHERRPPDDHDAAGRRRASASRTWRRCWCSTSRCCPRCETLFVRAKEVLGGAGRADHARAAAARCWRCPRRRRRTSGARCSPSAWGRTSPRRCGPAWRWRWAGRRPSTPSCAR